MEKMNNLLNFEPNLTFDLTSELLVSAGGIVLIVLLLCFDVFALILVKQVSEMSKNVITPAGIPLKIGAKFFLAAGMFLTITTVLTII